MTNTSKDVDVAVVGAGMVGLSVAIALAKQDLKIAVIETHPVQTEWDDSEFDLRVSAITRATQYFLDYLDAWPIIGALRVSPYREMHVWDATGHGEIHFDCADVGQACLGHIIENRVIQSALFQRTQEYQNIEWFCPAAPASMTVSDTEVRLNINTHTHINAKLIIGADGAHSWVRTQAGIEIRSHDYRQTAIVANVKTQLAHGDTAWQRFLPNGPLAFLPLNDGVCSIVWSTTPEHAQQLLELPDEQFKDQLCMAFGAKLGAIVDTGKRAAFPLRSQTAKQYVAARVALVGDAAHIIHPLAGQGANLGFMDAAAIAETIMNAQRQGKDIGSRGVLRRYERSRKSDNVLMQNVTSGFKLLFSNHYSLLSALRNTGLVLFDKAIPLKHEIILRAMGLKGDLPALARNPIYRQI